MNVRSADECRKSRQIVLATDERYDLDREIIRAAADCPKWLLSRSVRFSELKGPDIGQ
jgi:hypothetical protein